MRRQLTATNINIALFRLFFMASAHLVPQPTHFDRAFLYLFHCAETLWGAQRTNRSALIVQHGTYLIGEVLSFTAHALTMQNRRHLHALLIEQRNSLTSNQQSRWAYSKAINLSVLVGGVCFLIYTLLNKQMTRAAKIQITHILLPLLLLAITNLAIHSITPTQRPFLIDTKNSEDAALPEATPCA